ncbi:SGNH/GDSL hydrolase family protein [Sphingomonas crusticola]|uniref:SGNH/GDSL hydrolase family protein n=1 Tax=Sphingomonas crusticola TaxID=1697973 RepID=UPI0013C36F47|nr:SGNH/GDSL hydrolase family protein [Sphingomonas crusticola]
MRLRLIMLGMALCASAATAAPREQPARWVGAWGYAVSPNPPGQLPPTPIALTAGPLVPLAAPPAASPPPAPIPKLDNPGGLPVDGSSAELANATIRQIVRVSAAGNAIRLRLSNESGVEPLSLGAVHVGLAEPDGSVQPGSDHVVTFGGHNGVMIPAGAPLLSDPIALPVKALDRLAISLHVPDRLIVRGARSLFHYVAGEAGDSTGAAQLPNARLARAPGLVTGVEVAATQPTNVIVTLGDSITEGSQSTANAFRGWPDRLAERLAARPGKTRWAVVNAGIGGNRLLRYGSGPNALARFDRDVLSVPGVKVLILLEGINDIGRGYTTKGSVEPATAEALQAAQRQIIERAHEHGIRVIGATLTPYKGATYWAEPGEAVRQALNGWIRTSGAYDGVIDFAPVVADKSDPLTFDRAYNDTDHLHPNDAGYRAMGDAIDLNMVTGE